MRYFRIDKSLVSWEFWFLFPKIHYLNKLQLSAKIAVCFLCSSQKIKTWFLFQLQRRNFSLQNLDMCAISQNKLRIKYFRKRLDFLLFRLKELFWSLFEQNTLSFLLNVFKIAALNTFKYSDCALMNFMFSVSGNFILLFLNSSFIRNITFLLHFNFMFKKFKQFGTVPRSFTFSRTIKFQINFFGYSENNSSVIILFYSIYFKASNLNNTGVMQLS